MVFEHLQKSVSESILYSAVAFDGTNVLTTNKPLVFNKKEEKTTDVVSCCRSFAHIRQQQQHTQCNL